MQAASADRADTYEWDVMWAHGNAYGYWVIHLAWCLAQPWLAVLHRLVCFRVPLCTKRCVTSNLGLTWLLQGLHKTQKDSEHCMPLIRHAGADFRQTVSSHPSALEGIFVRACKPAASSWWASCWVMPVCLPLVHCYCRAHGSGAPRDCFHMTGCSLDAASTGRRETGVLFTGASSLVSRGFD